ncbi:hypothetical protein [Atopococcus tabaci]|uniref:hypothetical protein n=1 Tax=Atopococcus tabaci TaxID=269774 RepID=UPI0012EC58CA|nr:hypothetical protein [Atopococcus tabaci]
MPNPWPLWLQLIAGKPNIFEKDRGCSGLFLLPVLNPVQIPLRFFCDLVLYPLFGLNLELSQENGHTSDKNNGKSQIKSTVKKDKKLAGHTDWTA